MELVAMRFPAIVILVAVSVAKICSGAEHTKDSLDEVKQNLSEKKAILIDVREQKEWNNGHLQDARLLPLSQLRQISKDSALQQKLEKDLPKDRIIYCHCGSGIRVLTASGILGELGYDIRPLAAGFDDLHEAGFPTAKK
jgi:phage shock protein E